jgi:hypothetical protein
MLTVPARRLLVGLVLTAAALVSLSTGSALAAATATTGAATNVTATTASVSGTITATDADTAYSFVYGTSTTYTLNSKPVVAKVGTNTVTATLSGLQPSTTYHYELIADDAVVEPVQVVHGSDATFTTLPAPVATTESATGVQQTSAVLHGLANPSQSAVYAFQYGTSTSYTAQTASATTPAGAQQVSTTITGLQAGTTYHFRLVVVQVNLLGAYYDVPVSGSDLSFTTKSPPHKKVTKKKKFGTVGLRTGKLKDKGGKVKVSLHCSGPGSARCAGKISLKVKIGKKSRKAGSSSFSSKAGRNFSVTITLPAKVAAAAKGHTLAGGLTGTFSTHQKKLTHKITIKG